MSLFDVIRYGRVDIESEGDLNRLPSEVVKEWCARVVEHACQSAESVVHKDKSGKCQELIDMTRKYMRGEIDNDVLDEAYAAARDAASDAASDAARDAARDAANAANAANAARDADYEASDAAYIAAYAASDAVYDAASDAVYDAAFYAAMKLYKEWIMEELMAYESEEFVQ